MVLETLNDSARTTALADEAHALMALLYPICRSITGDGVRQTLDHVNTIAPLRRTEVPSGTPVFDWTVPREWNIRDAYIADAAGQRLVDFKQHSLHVVSYSTPVRERMSRQALEPHLHSLPDRPHAIPYRTAYYRETWGFCLSQQARDALGEGPFDVCIDSSLQDGHLSIGECLIPGQSGDEAVVYTHTCHPALANDNLSGIALAAVLARELATCKPRLTWRFVFGPGTIGSLTWLSRNEGRLGHVRAGLVMGLLGDSGPLNYKHSRRGGTLIDRAAALAMRDHGGHELPFEPYGYDERQFCSPGFDLPFGRLTRSPNATFAQYHNSDDNLDFVGKPALAGALQALGSVVQAVDGNQRFINLSPKGEPQLGKRGLYGNVGGTGPGAFEHGLLWLLNQSDGRHDLINIAQRSGLPFETLARGAAALQTAALLAPAPATAGGHETKAGGLT